MRTGTASQSLKALSLCLLLVACSTTPPPILEPSGPHELARYVLLIQELPDGQVTHAWKPTRDFNLEQYRALLGTARVSGHIKPVVWQRNCDEEMKECLSQCMGINLGADWQHLFHPPSRRLGGKHAECRRRCSPLYDECNKQNAEDAAKAAELPSVDRAIDWLKRHREEVGVGAVIVIAGVAFVVVTGGSGGLLLAPVLLFASSDVHPGGGHIAATP